MPQLLQYRQSDGCILGLAESDRAPLLALQPALWPEATAALAWDGTIALEHLAQYEVRDGQVVPRQAVQLTATPNPFPADGVTVCTITLSPFQPCMLRVNGEAVTLTNVEDPLALTAEAPQIFTVTLDPTPGVWADPVRVEAV